MDSQSKGTPGWHGKKGKKADFIGVHTEDVCALHTNEAYTTVCQPVSASNKGGALLGVKVDNGASINFLPLHLFRNLYPNYSDKKGHQTGLNVSNIRLTAYSDIQIPLFGSLHGPIIWQPGSPIEKSHQINSCWFVADTPGPAILGLPSYERLEVVKMNCTVKVIQDTSKILPFVPTPAPPALKKTTPIKSTEDLIIKFPDRFQGIGQFPCEYTIRLCDNGPPRNVLFHTP